MSAGNTTPAGARHPVEADGEVQRSGTTEHNSPSPDLAALREPSPKRGEIRVIDGWLCRFIERELEGDKWETLRPASPTDVLAQRCRSQAGLLRAMDAIANADRMRQTQEPTAKLLDEAALALSPTGGSSE